MAFHSFFLKQVQLNISSILTEKSIAKNEAGNTHLLKKCMCSGTRCNSRRQIQATQITSTIPQALDDICSACHEGGSINMCGRWLGLEVPLF